jgi:hypothetical protein
VAAVGVHGLPSEYSTAATETEDWIATVGYLKALARSGRPIVVALSDERASHSYVEQIGFLRHLDEIRPDGSESFSLHWPDEEQLSGRLHLPESGFEGARLSTVDGDDYFGLKLSYGNFQIVVCDSNVRLDQAHPQRTRGLDDLPTPADMELELARLPQSEVGRQVLDEISALREALTASGADKAATLSDSELMATAVEVRWKLFQHPAAGDDWVRALADRLR